MVMGVHEGDGCLVVGGQRVRQRLLASESQARTPASGSIMRAATRATDVRQSRGTLHTLVAPGRARVVPARLTLLMPCVPGASVGHWGPHERPRYSFL